MYNIRTQKIRRFSFRYRQLHLLESYHFKTQQIRFYCYLFVVTKSSKNSQVVHLFNQGAPIRCSNRPSYHQRQMQLLQLDRTNEFQNRFGPTTEVFEYYQAFQPDKTPAIVQNVEVRSIDRPNDEDIIIARLQSATQQNSCHYDVQNQFEQLSQNYNYQNQLDQTLYDQSWEINLEKLLLKEEHLRHGSMPSARLEDPFYDIHLSHNLNNQSRVPPQIQFINPTPPAFYKGYSLSSGSGPGDRGNGFGGGGRGDGSFSSGYGSPSGDNGGLPILFYLISIFAGLVFLSWAFKQFEQALLDQQKKLQNWSSQKDPQKRAYVILSKGISCFLALLVGPDLFLRTTGILFGARVRALLTGLSWLLRSGFMIGLFLGGACLSLNWYPYVMGFINPILNQTITFFAGPENIHPTILFIEKGLKTVFGSLLCSFGCVFILKYQNKKVIMLLATCGCFIGVYFVLNDFTILRIAAIYITRQKVISYLVNCQMGRFALLAGTTYAMQSFKSLPFCDFFYILFVYLLGVFSLALSATPQLLP